MGDGVSSGLVAKGLIYRSSSVGNVVAGFAYNIQALGETLPPQESEATRRS